jgi:hypothetical protein
MATLGLVTIWLFRYLDSQSNVARDSNGHLLLYVAVTLTVCASLVVSGILNFKASRPKYSVVEKSLDETTTKSLPAEIKTESPTPPAIASQHSVIHAIGFGYIPISPLENGWKQAYDPDGLADFGSDPDIPGSLRMKILRNKVAIHHDLPPHAILADHLEFTAKYTNAKNPTMIHTHLIVGTKDWSAQRNVFIKYYYGELHAVPTWPNPNPGRDAAKWLPEQTIYLPAQVRPGGQLIFDINLRDAVSLCLGSQGWLFKSIQGVRLRGDLSISPIVLSLTATL